MPGVQSRYSKGRVGQAVLLAGVLWLAGAGSAWAEEVTFRSAVPAPRLSQPAKVDRPGDGPPQELTGRLAKPPGPGPFPAVVLLHGCAGVVPWNERWSERLLAWGYVVLDVDSLTPRGYDNVCQRVFAVAPATRALDAFGAKAFLERLPFVAPERIAVLGMSHGAWAAVIAAQERKRPFGAAVAFYPWCEGPLAPASPLLILIGGRDDWTPAARCQAALPAPQDSEVILKVYPEAHHGFDFEGLDENQNGHVVRYDEAAAKDAVERVRAFLAMRLGGGGE